MAKMPNRLGRGLSTLIPAGSGHAGSGLQPAHLELPGHPHQSNQIRQIPLSQLHPNPHQPRTSFDQTALRELAESIRASGVLQPILARQVGADVFEIVAGERRWRAASLAGLQTVPVIVRELTAQQSFEMALVENLQREDLGPLERAGAYQHYLESFGGTIEALADRIGESRANISNYLRLLKLRPEICYLLGTGELGMGQARAIAGVEDPERQLALARIAARRNLSVRQVEELVRKPTASPEADTPVSAEVAARRIHLDEVSAALSKGVGLRVKVLPGRRKNSGRIVISFRNLDEFDRIARLLGGDVHLE